MDIKKDIIGIVGGMGSYATLNIFKRILDSFEAEKEWDRPRIIIDNNCTLPSRSRALLYHEKYEEVVNGLMESISLLMKAGANIIILGSNTGHLFLDEILKRLPEAKKYLVDFIKLLSQDIKKENIKRVLLLGTEATLDFNIYKECLQNVEIVVPNDEMVKRINYFIEIVKQNRINQRDISNFKKLLLNFDEKNIIFGCTELPVLYELIKEKIDKNIYDPINSFIKFLK